MIDTLDLTNFQSHKDTELVLHPGVNAIVGPSDVGKSAILRALRWAVENQPSGDSFLRHGEKHVAVGVVVDGMEVIRDKGKQNRYVIMEGGEEDKAPEEFKALGVGKVPQEVADLINIQPDVNCQWQHDTPFLLGKGWTPGEVAKTLNRAVNLEVIDSAMYRTDSMRLKTGQALQGHKSGLARVDADLEELAGLDELDAKVGALEEAGRALRAKTDEQCSLTHLVDDAGANASRIAALPHIPPDAEDRIDALAARLARHGDLEGKRRGLGGLVRELSVVGEALARLDWTGVAAIRLVAVQNQAGDLDTKQDVFGELEKLLLDIGANDHLRTDALVELESWQADFDKLMPDECPLCGQEVA